MTAPRASAGQTARPALGAGPDVGGLRAILFVALLALPAISATAAEKPGQKTVITGARMNLLRKGEAVEFVGGVTLVRGDDLLKADRMVSEEGRSYTEAWGNVYLRRDDRVGGVRWESWADEAVYDGSISSGTLRGRKKPARVKRRPLPGATAAPAAADLLDMDGERITFYSSTGPFTVGVPASTEPVSMTDAEGKVYVRFEEAAEPRRLTEVWAGRALFDGASRSAMFRLPHDPAAGDPRPRALQAEAGETRDLMGGTITYFMDDKRLVAEENVRALILSAEPKGKP